MKRFSLLLILLPLTSLAIAVPESVEQATDYSCAIDKDGWPVILLDPLPDDAFELSRDVVEDYINYLYPDENIVIGEAFSLYLIPNYSQPLVVGHIIALDPSSEVTIQQVINLFREEEEAFKLLNSFTDNYNYSYNIHEDVTFTELKNDYALKRAKTRAYRYVLIGFTQGVPNLLVVGLASVFGRLDVSYEDKVDLTSDSYKFLSYGLIPPNFIHPLFITHSAEVLHLIDDSVHILEGIDYYEGKHFPVPDRDPKTFEFYLEFTGFED